MNRKQQKSIIIENLKNYPAVVLVGPRQSGKTTLAKEFNGMYFDLEKESDQIKLIATWGEVSGSNKIIILDEAQNYPEIFKILRPAIDEDRKRNGRFLLLGSVAPSLMMQVSESLAGRLAICELTPFLSIELPKNKEFQNWIMGGYPDGGIIQSKSYPDWQINYLRLLAERDLPSWGLPSKPIVTTKLFKMLSVLNGQIWNASEIGGSLGLSYHTINSYLEYLVGCFLIRILPPYHSNIKKRIIKSPKIYWRDTGLLHALLGFTKLMNKKSHSEIFSMPWVGRSWEGWIIEQIISSLKLNGLNVEANYFRTSDGKEIDLVLETGKELWAIEIKLTSQPSTEMMNSLMETGKLIGATHFMLVSKTKETIKSKNFISANLKEALKFLV